MSLQRVCWNQKQLKLLFPTFSKYFNHWKGNLKSVFSTYRLMVILFLQPLPPSQCVVCTLVRLLLHPLHGFSSAYDWKIYIICESIFQWLFIHNLAQVFFWNTITWCKCRIREIARSVKRKRWDIYYIEQW